MDWNGDGKHDWKDGVYYNLVINPTDDTDMDESEKYNGANPIVVILIIVCLVLQIVKWFN